MNTQQRLLREDEVDSITGLSRVTRWRLSKQGKFPQPVKLGEGRLKRYVASEIADWVNQQIAGRDAGLVSRDALQRADAA